MALIEYFFVFWFGAVIGSFLNVCIYRLPRRLSIVFPASFCPSCKSPVPHRYNIPVVGYAMTGGKCAACGIPISARYPLVETMAAMTAVACHALWEFPLSLANFLFVAAMLVITFVDIDFQIIPAIVHMPRSCMVKIVGVARRPFRRAWRLGPLFSLLYTLPEILIAGAAAHLLHDRPAAAIAGAAVAGGGGFYLIGLIYKIATSREGLGFGDVTLMTLFGAYLGLRAVPFITLAGSLAGTVYGVWLMAARGRNATFAVPFGPFLAFGAALYLFAGDAIILWYLGLVVR